MNPIGISSRRNFVEDFPFNIQETQGILLKNYRKNDIEEILLDIAYRRCYIEDHAFQICHRRSAIVDITQEMSNWRYLIGVSSLVKYHN